MTIQDHTLYVAATESLVSQKTGDNAWSKMAGFASSLSLSEFDEAVSGVEAAIKADFSITSLPNPWRSAKSVVRNAIFRRIKLVDDNGVALGKTAVQELIKRQKEVVKTAHTPYQKAMSSIEAFSRHLRCCSDDEIAELKTYANTFL